MDYKIIQDILQDQYTTVGIAFIAGVLGGYIASIFACKRCKATLPASSEQDSAKEDGTQQNTTVVTTHPTPAEIPDTPPTGGIPPTPASPPPPSQEDIQKQKLELVASFPELEVIVTNTDTFKELVYRKKLDVPEKVKPTLVLTARRISDMVYKHQKVLLGTSGLSKTRIFAATILLLQSLHTQDETV